MSEILSVENNARLPVEKSAVNTACALYLPNNLLYFCNPTSLQCRMCSHNYVRTIPVKFLGLYPWL